MPLLNDAKICYVGTQPITTIMAGSVQVWPKGPPPPFRNIQLWSLRFDTDDFGTLCTSPSDMACSSPYITWDVYPRPKNCARGASYLLQNIRDGGASSSWQDVSLFGFSGWRSYLPDSKPNSMVMMALNVTSFAPSQLRRYDWRIVYDDGIEPAVYSDSVRFAGTDEEIRSQVLPLEYQENECSGRP